MSWPHKPECTDTWCYCLEDMADPICECGCPAWACDCHDDWEDVADEYYGEEAGA